MMQRYQRIEKMDMKSLNKWHIKCWMSYLHVFIFLHKKSFSIVTQLHVQVN